jgi:hypothetical protein
MYISLYYIDSKTKAYVRVCIHYVLHNMDSLAICGYMESGLSEDVYSYRGGPHIRLHYPTLSSLTVIELKTQQLVRPSFIT